MVELEEIYTLYFKDVYFFAYSLTKDKHLAEDITSETFLKALKSLDSFKGESDIRVWLFQIAKNTYYSYLRKSKKETELDALEEIAAEIDIEKHVFTKEESMNVHKVLH
ncbi:RNA polymerase sigma factor [Marinilactibacillus sp. XAAS-LB27]|uniref:RNA polymerase sigma factor n=1 Tax=Marinilactibacillus sp. XAAS-LB27 TaxID=3114538 RepID=UPI002E16FAB8|nr:RNA polymerase sigma factor [Marinilactibacillus sp. XAAS-LB27]